MATTSADSVFLDTNILIYSTIAESPFHQPARERLQTLLNNDQQIWISRQVQREYLAIMTKPEVFSTPLTTQTLKERIQFFEQAFHVAEDGSEVINKLLSLLQTYPVGGKQIHDANIVATMAVYDIPTILTHNVSDFRRFSDEIQILPLIQET